MSLNASGDKLFLSISLNVESSKDKDSFIGLSIATSYFLTGDAFVGANVIGVDNDAFPISRLPPFLNESALCNSLGITVLAGICV